MVEDNLTVQKLAGLWAADYSEEKTDYDLHWNRVVEGYLFRAGGKGYYECYLLDGEEFVGAQAAREEGKGSFHYLISGNTVTVTMDRSSEKRVMTYSKGSLSSLKRVAFQKATAAQQTLVEQLYGEWQKGNSVLVGDTATIWTDVVDDYTDEPARSRQR